MSACMKFGGSHLFMSDIHHCFMVFWLSCLWVIWKERNSHIFSNKELSLDHVLDKIKLHSWWWLKAQNSIYLMDFSSWWSNPTVCNLYWLFHILEPFCWLAICFLFGCLDFDFAESILGTPCTWIVLTIFQYISVGFLKNWLWIYSSEILIWVDLLNPTHIRPM